VTGYAPFGFDRSVLIGERSLFVRVTLNASRVSAGGQSRLLEFKAPVRIVAIAALHRAFKNLMVKGLGEIGLRFTMAAHAKPWLAHLQDSDG